MNFKKAQNLTSTEIKTQEIFVMISLKIIENCIFIVHILLVHRHNSTSLILNDCVVICLILKIDRHLHTNLIFIFEFILNIAFY